MPQLESNSIYMTLNTRGIPGTFHWGIFITLEQPKGLFYHATSKFGGWQLEVKSSNPMNSMTLVIIYKIGAVSSPSQADQVLRGLPADGSPSLRTGEAFTCRIWVKDVLIALENRGLITLKADIDILEKEAIVSATRYESDVEQGNAGAKIVESGSSS